MIQLTLHTGATVHASVHTHANSERRKCLLLHGNPGSSLDWEPIVSRLSSFADVAAIDLPGFGKSPRPDTRPDALSLARLADHAVAAADALAWNEPFVLIGHSHGGGVAQTAAVRHPQRIAGVVLIATLGAPAHGSYRLLAAPGAARVARLAGGLFQSNKLRPISRKILLSVMKGIYSPEQVPASKVDTELAVFAARPEILVSMTHVALGRPSQQLLASAREIECPVLFLHGRDDALVPLRHAKNIHDRLVRNGRRSELRVIPGAGHMLMEFQAAEAAEAISGFLSA